MGQIVIMPKQGLQMTSGLITEWFANEGDTVCEGQSLFEMETDKLSISIDAPASGTLLKILCKSGESAEVAAPIAVIGDAGEDYRAVLSANGIAVDAPAADPAPAVCAEAPAAPAAPAAAPAGQVVIMPKLGLLMTEGLITAWLVNEGETAAEGEPLFEMETDKTTITIDAPFSGTLLKILHGKGDTVAVASPIAVIGEAGTDYRAILSAEPDAAQAPAAQNGRIFSSPRARTRAAELGIDYRTVSGTGPMGMVIERDVLAAEKAAAQAPAKPEPVKAAPAKQAAAAPETEELEIRTPISRMRRIIADRMQDSLNTLAQANHRLTVDMTAAAALRETFKAAGVKISYNDIVIRCVAKALTEHPMMNATMDDQYIIQKKHVNIGMAVATDTGLLVPVIRNADKLSLPQIAETSKELATATKENRLSPDHLTGGTFTISNLGMFDIESFTAIINKPEAGILAVGKIAKRPAVVDDELVIRPLMELSLTYDHRILDGAPAARFLRRVKELLENPGLLI